MMINQIVEIKVLTNFNPFDRMNLLEKPLAEFIKEQGAVVGGTSVIQTSKGGERIITHCSLDVILHDMGKGLIQVKDFFEKFHPDKLVEIKYILEDGTEKSISVGT